MAAWSDQPLPPSHSHDCDASTPWYLAPVIVGGSGGSGTRGMAMLLESLGVRMACVSGGSGGSSDEKPSLTDPSQCDLPCNAAADCGLISSYRGGDGLGWLRLNYSRVHGPCDEVDHAAVAFAANKSDPELCGGSKAAAARLLRSAVRPQYRKPLRWGLKNPHSTYYVNVLRATVFPCLVYVNTVRDLDGLVSASKHFGSRVQEAMRFGVLGEKEGDALARLAEATPKLRTTVAMQAFYGGFVRDVNLNLEAWLRRCLPGRSVHVPLQRMVALAPRSPGCVFAVARPLALALRLEEAEVVNSIRRFAAASLPLVRESLAKARGRRTTNYSWPTGSLQPAECVGRLV